MLKKIVLLSFLLVVSSAQADWVLDNDSDYLAILKINYADSAFEGGYLYKFNTNKDYDSLPLRMNFLSTWDSATVSFVFTPDSTEIFKGGAFWMGTGHIAVPDTFYAQTQFPKSPVKVIKPLLFRQYYHEPLDSQRSKAVVIDL